MVAAGVTVRACGLDGLDTALEAGVGRVAFVAV